MDCCRTYLVVMILIGLILISYAAGSSRGKQQGINCSAGMIHQINIGKSNDEAIEWLQHCLK